jgi:hypothetical protein
MGVAESLDAEATWQRQQLHAHVANPDTWLCVVCLSPAPCSEATQAAQYLVDCGLSLVDIERPGRRGGRLLTRVVNVFIR